MNPVETACSGNSGTYSTATSNPLCAPQTAPNPAPCAVSTRSVDPPSSPLCHVRHDQSKTKSTVFPNPRPVLALSNLRANSSLTSDSRIRPPALHTYFSVFPHWRYSITDRLRLYFSTFLPFGRGSRHLSRCCIVLFPIGNSGLRISRSRLKVGLVLRYARSARLCPLKH